MMNQRSIDAINEYKFTQVQNNKSKILDLLRTGNYTKLQMLEVLDAISSSTLERYLKLMADAGEVSRTRNSRRAEWIYGSPGVFVSPVKLVENCDVSIPRICKQNHVQLFLDNIFGFIKDNPGCTSKEISTYFDIDNTIARRYLRKLKKLKLISMVRTVHDGYRYTVSNHGNITLEGQIKYQTKQGKKDLMIEFLTKEGKHFRPVELAQSFAMDIKIVWVYLREMVEDGLISTKRVNRKNIFYAAADYDWNAATFDLTPLVSEKINTPRQPRIKKIKQPRANDSRQPRRPKIAKRKTGVKADISPVKEFEPVIQNVKSDVVNIVLDVLKNYGGVATIDQLCSAPTVNYQVIDYMIYKRYITMDKSNRPIKYKLLGVI